MQHRAPDKRALHTACITEGYSALQVAQVRRQACFACHAFQKAAVLCRWRVLAGKRALCTACTANGCEAWRGAEVLRTACKLAGTGCARVSMDRCKRKVMGPTSLAAGHAHRSTRRQSRSQLRLIHNRISACAITPEQEILILILISTTSNQHTLILHNRRLCTDTICSCALLAPTSASLRSPGMASDL